MTAKQAPEGVGRPTPGTPLPWPQPHLSLSGLNWLVSEMPPIAGARLEADARYIVHACNCFPELLEAAEHMLVAHESESATHYASAIAKLTAAIAKARGGSQ